MMELLAFGDTGWGDELLLSMVMTILVSTSSLAFGLIIGTIFASFKLSNSYILKAIAKFYTTVVRGVPGNTSHYSCIEFRYSLQYVRI